MALSARKLTKLAEFQGSLRVEKGWVAMFGEDLLLLRLTKVFVFKLR